VSDVYIGLEDALLRLTGDISDQEVDVSDQEPERLIKLAWTKRERAIEQLDSAFCNGDLIALARNPKSGALIQLIGMEWRGAGGRRDTIISGIVHGSLGEQISNYNGHQVLLQQAKFQEWRKQLARQRPQPDQPAFEKWLEGLMRTTPERRPKAKPELAREAKAQFSISRHEFDRTWAAKLKVTGASWGKPGAPSKLPK
jgi:hypothetical protein